MTYQKPERWADPAKKLFPHQVAFTAPPHDFDAAPTDFLRIAPETVGVHGRMLHLKGYKHQLQQRTDNFFLLEEYVECMANNGVDVCGQVGTNWVHAGGKTPVQITDFLARIEDTYQTPLHMAGQCLVEGLRELGAERIALNSVYYWPDWRDGIARYLRESGFDVVLAANFVDLGFFETQAECNDCTWVFPGDFAARSMEILLDRAGPVDAIAVNGMPNFRRADGLPQRMNSREVELEALTGVSIVSSDSALYWRIMKTLGIAPNRPQGRLLSTLA